MDVIRIGDITGNDDAEIMEIEPVDEDSTQGVCNGE